MVPFKGQQPRIVHPLQRDKDIVRCAALSAEVPGQASNTPDANLDCGFIEKTLIFIDPKFGWPDIPRP